MSAIDWDFTTTTTNDQESLLGQTGFSFFPKDSSEDALHNTEDLEFEQWLSRFEGCTGEPSQTEVRPDLSRAPLESHDDVAPMDTLQDLTDSLTQARAEVSVLKLSFEHRLSEMEEKIEKISAYLRKLIPWTVDAFSAISTIAGEDILGESDDGD